MPVPVVVTPRLRLRGHAASDLHECVRLWADERVVRHILGRPSTMEEAWSRLLRYAGLWSLLGFGYWLVEERATGAFVGEVGLADFRRDIEPSFDGALEAGWVLHPDAQGRGFATEAVRAALDWSDGHLGRRRVACMVAPENTPSLRVAEKCGFREFARTAYKGEPTILLERV